MIVAEDDIRRARILIVDDKEVNVSLLEQMLRDAGYTNVSSAIDPRYVCALDREHRYDLILLDLQMPDMDGFEVMGALKAHHVDDYLPVLVVTALPGHKVRALQDGARDFVSKPFDLLEVKTRIRNMLEVRLLYKQLEEHGQRLEQLVLERTAALGASEARYRSLTELASDWYWEQDEHGRFTKISGPVLEMLGIRGGESPAPVDGPAAAGWNSAEREALWATIAARQPILDFVFSRTNADGSTQRFQVSGEPMFNEACRFVGYRGIGVELCGKSSP